MNSYFHSWLGQVTTGHGVMILGPTLLAAAAGTMPWGAAIPLLVAGLVGLLWPENAGLQAATSTIATDVESLISAYRTGLDHAAAQAVPTGSVPQVSARTGTAALVGILVAGSIGLTACGNQTPSERAAEAQAFTSGLVCVADAGGQIVGVAATDDPDAVKAANAAVAAGATLATNAACLAAIAGGATALAGTTVAPPSRKIGGTPAGRALW